MTDCVFCEIVAGESPAVRVYEDERTLAFMDIFPGTDGHLLVIPRLHSRDLLEIGAEDLTAVTLAAQRIARVVVEELGADGVNLLNCCGAEAWQSVYHFHLHVVPRYADQSKDALVPPWRPGISGDRALLEELGGRLASALG
ncbi:HIT family protein [Brevibacterium album]|uniref:HIT family protein n=1 Tax=Brevibacterium album TaxID=417948 RepID=UPI000490583B|nr:HIT family protein [Brevibacterium album]